MDQRTGHYDGPMTTIGRLLTFATTFVVALFASASVALADTPVGPDWPAEEGRGALGNLLIFGGGTVGLFVLVALFGLATARKNHVPPPPSTDLATTTSDVSHH